jgi:NAD(P)-dependent dehydrogenase (short-subunit alcohol dehydrogenase family)
MTDDRHPDAGVAIVVGAGGELGRATAVKLADRGMTAVAVDRNEPGLEGLPDGIAREVIAYSASRAALVHLIRILDLELRPSGIRVNSVAPQWLDTARGRASFPEEVLAHAVAPESIPEIVAFLVSDEAAPISGAILPAYGA